MITRTPDTFPDARLLIKDFDGTVAQTFAASPNGIDVQEAYEQAVEHIFGITALDNYKQQGGLRNRSGVEVVQGLAPDAAGDSLNQLVDQLVGTKLGILMSEIGTRFPDGSVWPRPTPGYLELREKMEAARAEDGLLLDDLILSAGHKLFIAATYNAWGVNQPTYVVTEETVQQSYPKLPTEQYIKPSPLVMQVAQDIWRRDYGLGLVSPSADKAHIVYVGDDPFKDGELARRSNIDFVLLDADSSFETWQTIALRLELGNLAAQGTSWHAE